MAELVITKSEKTCRCGHTKDHPMVAQEPEYSGWGWFLLAILGISARPVGIASRCTICGTKLALARSQEAIDRVDVKKKAAER